MQALPMMSRAHSIRRPTADILLSSIALAALTGLLGFAAAGLLNLGTDYWLRAVVGFCLAAGVIGTMALRRPAIERFGAANRVTFLRVAFTVLAAAAIGESPDAALSWSIVVLITLTLFLDGLDGYLARRTQTMSAYGARFDMETDAALILVLSLLAWQFGKAGVWILAAGGMRYAFVLSARVLGWMRRPLPPSRRRQAVCIWQSALLLGVISPLFPSPASDLLAAGTVLMLGASFAVDIRWLWRQRADSKFKRQDRTIQKRDIGLP
jgi:phosphatidylglycerophosphate synthase